MNEPKIPSNPNQTVASISASGFLGGSTVAALFLLIQIESDVLYSEILIPFVAAIAILFILSVVEFTRSLGNHKGEYLKQIVTRGIILFIMGLIGLLIMIPVMVFPYSLYGAIILFVILGLFLFSLLRKKTKT